MYYTYGVSLTEWQRPWPRGRTGEKKLLNSNFSRLKLAEGSEHFEFEVAELFDAG